MRKKILVTGGTGFIGSHTVVALIEEGFDVTIIDNLANSSIEVLKGIKTITGKDPSFYQIDLTDGKLLSKYFEENPQFDGIIHFAAYKAVGESVEQPLKYYSNNLNSLLNLLEEAKKHNILNFVFSSSCTVYGQPSELPVTEGSPVQAPESPYGNTKKISEEIIRDIVNSSSLQAICLRYFNPIGAHHSALIGELPIGVPNNLMPIITQTAIGKREKVIVYGNDYPTPDGSCIRDYIHVVDLAKAHIVAIKRLIEGQNKTNLEIFNAGTGRGYSVLEVINAFEKTTGVPLNYEIGERRKGDVIQIYADTTLINKELGWNAQETLETMVGSAWKWQMHLAELAS